MSDLTKDQQLYEPRMRADTAVQALQFHGFVRCDIAACNCGSWHPRYGYPERFREIEDALTEADINLNGVTLLTAIKGLIANAKRYTFLRCASASDQITVETFGHPDGVCHLGGDDLDAAIDEAMEQKS